MKERKVLDDLLNGGILPGTVNQVEIAAKEEDPTLITAEEETEEEVGLFIEEGAKVVEEKEEEHSDAVKMNFDAKLEFLEE